MDKAVRAERLAGLRIMNTGRPEERTKSGSVLELAHLVLRLFMLSEKARLREWVSSVISVCFAVRIHGVLGIRFRSPSTKVEHEDQVAAQPFKIESSELHVILSMNNVSSSTQRSISLCITPNNFQEVHVPPFTGACDFDGLTSRR